MPTRELPVAPVSLRKPIPADPKDYFSAEEVDKSRSYQRPLQRARLAGTIITALATVALIGLKIGPKLIEAIWPNASWPFQLVVVIVAFVVILSIVGLPIGIWTEFGHEKKWGFSTQTPSRFFADQVKGILLGVVLLSILLVPIWALVRNTDLWWVWGTVVFIVFSVGIAILFPILIVPIFNKLTPLEDESLKARLMTLASKAGVDISEYKVMDASKRTKKDNAFFAGMGKTRSVVIYDNMLQTPSEQVEVVVAHEIGHWRRGHIKRQILLAVFTSLATFGFVKWATSVPAVLRFAGVKDLAEPAALPLFLAAFSLASVVLGIVSAWFSRWFEREADLDALELTHDVDAYTNLWRSMTTRNLPDLTPNWWSRVRASHPPIAERMAFASTWSKSRG